MLFTRSHIPSSLDVVFRRDNGNDHFNSVAPIPLNLKEKMTDQRKTEDVESN